MDQNNYPEMLDEVEVEAVKLTVPTFLELRLYIISSIILTGTLVVPFVLHLVGIAGQVFMPLYLFVLLSGLVYGWRCGLLVGLLAPIISFSMTQMPPMMILPFVVMKAALLGFVSGFLMESLKGKKLYLCALIAVVFFQLIGNLVLYLGTQNAQMAFVDLMTGYPGLVLLLVAVPWASYKIVKYERKIVQRYKRQVAGN